MGKLIYASNMSIDGYTEDADGGFDWAPPDEDVFAAISGVMASAGTYLYGRRMYETMAPWETELSLAEASALTARFASIWQAPDKVVYSSSLAEPFTARTRLERRFDADAVRALKEASVHDLLVGGPTLAAQAMAAGLVDEVVLFVWPIVLGGRKPALAPVRRVDLALVHARPVGTDVVEMRYRVR